MNAPAEDMLANARNHFFQEARLSLASLPIPINDVFITPRWNSLAILAASQSMIDFREMQEMKASSAREFVAHLMFYYLKALDKDHTKRRLKKRDLRLAQLIKEAKTLEDADACSVETWENLRPGFEDRTANLKQIRDAYHASIRKPNIAVHLLRSPKAVLTSSVDSGRSFYGEMEDLVATLVMKRKGSRITLLADMIRASVRKAHPVWMTTLGKATDSVMPNHQLTEKERAYPVEQREGMEAVGQPVGTPPEAPGAGSAPSIVR